MYFEVTCLSVNEERMEYVCWWMIAAFLFLPPCTNLALVSVRDFNDISFSETIYRNQYMGVQSSAFISIPAEHRNRVQHLSLSEPAILAPPFGPSFSKFILSLWTTLCSEFETPTTLVYMYTSLSGPCLMTRKC